MERPVPEVGPKFLERGVVLEKPQTLEQFPSDFNQCVDPLTHLARNAANWPPSSWAGCAQVRFQGRKQA